MSSRVVFIDWCPAGIRTPNRDIGDVAAKHEEMSLQYYNDVQDQAQQSFLSAKLVSRIGFGVLIATLAYTLVFGALSRLHWTSLMEMPKGTLTTACIGDSAFSLSNFLQSRMT